MSNILTEQIAKIIEKMLIEGGGELEFRRNEFASSFGCVPSQINYVLSSRFAAEHGYIVESRRGGGGFIRIVKVAFNEKNTLLMHVLAAIGDKIDLPSAKAVLASLYENSIVSDRELQLIYASITDRALYSSEPTVRNNIRADILKSIILTLKMNELTCKRL